MYQFICSNNHVSYSAAKSGHNDTTCPECGEPTILVSEDQEGPGATEK